MYSLKNRAFAGVLALLMLLSMTGCAGTTSGEGSSGSTVTQEEYDALKEQNEKLQAELDELKGETDGEAEDGTEPDASGEGEDTSGSSASGSAPADNASSSAPAQTSSAAPVQQTAPAQTSTASGKGPLAKYTVNVTDSSTPAVSVSGRSIDGKSGYYFYSADDDILGYIASNVVSQINRDYKMIQKTDEEHKAWYVEQFNVLRGVEGSSGSTGSGSSGSSSGSTGSGSSKLDIDEYCEEVIHLANIEREAAGLDPLVMDETAMEYAQIRAKELASSFSHIRPDNKASSMDGLEFVENGAKGSKTPEQVVNTWMNSSGHKATLLTDYSAYGNRTGVGVYQTDNGTIYWVQVFVYWDANA